MISESGLESAESLCHLRRLGFRGFLIGEALMRAGDPETALRDLIAAAEDRSATGGIRRDEQAAQTGARQS